MIKTIYMIFFVCAFALGLWACAGNKKEEYKDTINFILIRKYLK